MQCEDVLVELDAYSTGELDPGISAEIEQHIRQCIHCGAELKTLAREKAVYREYADHEGLPSPSWVEDQISEHQPGAIKTTSSKLQSKASIHRRLWPVAAALLIALSVSWYFLANRSARQMGDLGTPEAPVGISPSVQHAISDFEQAIAMLQVSYATKKEALDPALVEELDSNLMVTERAITECKQALKENPHDDGAITILMFDYQKHLGILRHITEEL
jgi:hypothetical protein